jgi:ribonucleoside-diphosphate reductase alpha chain
VYDIVAHTSDAVLAGGVRRSALICIFSHDDELMMNAKTGNWWKDNGHRARSNNSALLLRNKTTLAEFMKLLPATKQFGEPGFIWADSTETLFNPCVEACLYGYDKQGRSGFQFCNLCEINMKGAATEDEFYSACLAASILGTLQASYTNFGYLGAVTRGIVESEALLGISMTGMMDNPSISYDPRILRNGTRIIKRLNTALADILRINPAARLTCIKPAGTTSCILNTSSGIHPRHSMKYFRRVQTTKNSKALQFYKSVNLPAVKTSVWSTSKTDDVVTFLCQSPPNAIVKSEVKAIELLEKVKLVQENWVLPGSDEKRSLQPYLKHNVSNTINVAPDEWEGVFEYIYKNRKYFTGVSLLSTSGDLDYEQAPFQEIIDHVELPKIYGPAAMFASGLITRVFNVFEGGLYEACSTFLGIGIPLKPLVYDGHDPTNKIADNEILAKKYAWVAMANKFTDNFFRADKTKPATLSDKTKMTHCLKHVDAFHRWCKLERCLKPVDWTEFHETTNNTRPSETEACAGGSCSLKRV